MTKRLADGALKQTLAPSLFTPSQSAIDSTIISSSLLRLSSSNLSTLVRGRTNVSIVAFDLDGTLIKTKSGRAFPKEANDWVWAFPDVVKTIRKAMGEGKLCVIFSNQASKLAVSTVQERIRQVLLGISLPAIAYAALAKDHYRKPDTGMWDHLQDYLSTEFNATVDVSASIFIGDAAGRIASSNPIRKQDFSHSDRAFAMNAGIEFKTPEEYFLGHEPLPFKIINPTQALPEVPDRAALEAALAKLNNDQDRELEILLLVGWPASGKSTFCRKYLSSYAIINQDVMKTAAKCLKLGEESLRRNRSICVDNTNFRKTSRSAWIALAQSLPFKCRVRVAKFEVDRVLAEHLNCVRAAQSSRSGLGPIKIPDVAYHTYAKFYVEPSTEEGICDIIPIPFVPEFTTDQNRLLFNRTY
uniref:Polynucleotide kinase 3'-phosphatase n=1 Tax=Spongospora subterranea TaxID=70186 RepID=A0A0H5R8Y6_9EUKA|eukprot:CRZ10585.1 hypothetical protein [Spongospora subterranea]